MERRSKKLWESVMDVGYIQDDFYLSPRDMSAQTRERSAGLIVRRRTFSHGRYNLYSLVYVCTHTYTCTHLCRVVMTILLTRPPPTPPSSSSLLLFYTQAGSSGRLCIKISARFALTYSVKIIIARESGYTSIKMLSLSLSYERFQ